MTRLIERVEHRQQRGLVRIRIRCGGALDGDAQGARGGQFDFPDGRHKVKGRLLPVGVTDMRL